MLKVETKMNQDVLQDLLLILPAKSWRRRAAYRLKSNWGMSGKTINLPLYPSFVG